MINTVVTLAREEEDYATENFFRKFVDEQVEEEALFGNIVDKLHKAGESGLFVLENDLGHKK